MRLFVAIELPQEIKQLLGSIEKDIPKDTTRIALVKPENIHATLKFLGEVPENKVKDVQEALNTLSFKPFSLTTATIGVFPSVGYIRVVWVGFEREEAIIALQKQVDERLENYGFPREKDFVPHLTICRVQYVKDKEKFAKAIKAIHVEKRTFPVNSFVLMQSTLTKDGPAYAIIEKYQQTV